MEIREATAQDVAAIARIHVTSWRVAYAGKLPQTVVAQHSYAQRQKLWQQRYQTDGVLVAEDNQVILGFIAGGPQRSHPAINDTYPQEVYGLYVDPARQQRGVGYRLWQARVADWSGWTADCLASNHSALRFYTRQGAQLVQAGEYVAERQTFPTRVLGFQRPVATAQDEESAT
ncbi:GNAT family N-acetyltransferase [Levilactobacillus zymae]|uniref:GNAT family N-acetyltransferase n=1 Tax=Levilactobacillus zymae TaxID=267363 RepID=UPI0028BA875E|nr:GNAT family N-acetyltransferase [Levilactobacillus zymae]MDT6979387.1 GNAT family N-acetyltransferase [Levilactobacillus zymae]